MGYRWFWFKFDGRVNRARYLLAALAILCMMFVAVFSLAMLGVMLGLGGVDFTVRLAFISTSVKLNGNPPSKAWWFPGIATLLLTLGFGWAYAAVAIKRLHDRNKSGWWLVPYVGVVGLNVQFGQWLGDAQAFTGPVAGILLLCGFIEMAFLRGTKGANRFGADPLPAQQTGPMASLGWDPQKELEFAAQRTGDSAARRLP